jgi:methyl-accepting chemotaxis protein-1 (serine sensor receptor)
MKNPSIKRQLAIAFGTLALLVLLVSYFALGSLGQVNRQFADYVRGEARRESLAVNVRILASGRAIAVRDMVLVGSADQIAQHKDAAVKAHEELQATLAALKQEVVVSEVSAHERAMVAAIDKVESAYAPVALSIVQLAAGDRRAEAVEKINVECRPLLAQLLAASRDYAAYIQSQGTAKVDEAAAAYATQRTMLLAVSAGAVAMAMLLGWLIVRRLFAALGAEPVELNAAARRVAQGDLGPVPGVDGAPDGSVLASMGAMQRQLVTLIGQVRGAADSIATASEQIAQGNLDLSSRTEEQAAALQQTAATMDEVGTTVRNTAANAQQANQLAQDASGIAVQGGAAFSRVVSTMRGINDSSKKIAEIISVIDGIAFQTNILALNAAVEAARAGEQGRGFAVVATEVRNLARRSADAAKEIKTLITDSVEQVADGSVQVSQAGETLQEIVGAIQRVSDIVGEISVASAEQSQGVGQVGEAVSQMDHVTQQNAALVEESAAAAENLKQQAQQLVDTVAMFKLDAQEDQPARWSAPAPAPRSHPVVPQMLRLKPAVASTVRDAGGWARI